MCCASHPGEVGPRPTKNPRRLYRQPGVLVRRGPVGSLFETSSIRPGCFKRASPAARPRPRRSRTGAGKRGSTRHTDRGGASRCRSSVPRWGHAPRSRCTSRDQSHATRFSAQTAGYTGSGRLPHSRGSRSDGAPLRTGDSLAGIGKRLGYQPNTIRNRLLKRGGSTRDTHVRNR